MSVTTLEATIENGQVKLLHPRWLPEHARVYVVVPDLQLQPVTPVTVIGSPRLKYPEQAAHFVKEVSDEAEDAVIR